MNLGKPVLLLFLLLAICSYAFSVPCSVPTNFGIGPSGTCRFKASCDATEIAVFYAAATTNAHASVSQNPPEYLAVCCPRQVAGGAANITGNSCAAPNKAVVLKLFDVSNSHVEQADQPNYTNNVCISADSPITCRYISSGSCNGTELAVASISDVTNAHVEESGQGNYPIQVCCGFTGLSSTTNYVSVKISTDSKEYVKDSTGNPAITLTASATKLNNTVASAEVNVLQARASGTAQSVGNLTMSFSGAPPETLLTIYAVPVNPLATGVYTFTVISPIKSGETDTCDNVDSVSVVVLDEKKKPTPEINEILVFLVGLLVIGLIARES